MTAKEFIRATRKQQMTTAQTFWASEVALALHTGRKDWLAQAVENLERVSKCTSVRPMRRIEGERNDTAV